MDSPPPQGGTLVRIVENEARRPAGAVGEMRIEAPLSRVWDVIRDVDRYPGRVPMVHQARWEGERVWMQIRFRIAILSAKFAFTAAAEWEDERWLEMNWISGEPAHIRMRFEVEALDEGRATLVRVAVSYDPRSLGWLVKFFLRHHPEIELGLFPGTTLVLLDALRRAAESP